MSHTVTVEFDQSLHPNTDFDSLDEVSKLSYAVLDTSYNLLREYAVRVTLASVREQVAEQGATLPADEEMFRLAEALGGPVSYMDLAPDLDIVKLGLHTSFHLLVEVAVTEASEAIEAETGE